MGQARGKQMRICIIGTGDAGATAANQIRRLDGEAQIDTFSRRAELGIPPCEMPLVIGGDIASRMPLVKLVQIDGCHSPHVQEDHLAVPMHRLIDKLG